ncbi:unnamed protein product, partial [Heterotrigona itama]
TVESPSPAAEDVVRTWIARGRDETRGRGGIASNARRKASWSRVTLKVY